MDSGWAIFLAKPSHRFAKPYGDHPRNTEKSTGDHCGIGPHGPNLFGGTRHRTHPDHVAFVRSVARGISNHPRRIGNDAWRTDTEWSACCNRSPRPHRTNCYCGRSDTSRLRARQSLTTRTEPDRIANGHCRTSHRHRPNVVGRSGCPERGSTLGRDESRAIVAP